MMIITDKIKCLMPHTQTETKDKADGGLYWTETVQ